MNVGNFHLDRRGLLRTGAVVGGVTLAGGLMSGCMDSSSSPNAGGQPRRGGTLRVAMASPSSSDTTDT